MSDTPRTLEVLTQILDRDGRLEEDNVPFILVRLAKTLELELNAAKAALSGRTVSCSNCNAMAEELAELKKQSGLTFKSASPLTIKRPPSRGTSNRRDHR